MPRPNKNPIKEILKTVELDQAAQVEGTREGRPSVFTCPDCGGVLWQVKEHEMVQFRCHVGHIVAGEQLFADQVNAAENALWKAIRILEDQMVLGRQLALFARGQKQDEAALQYEAQVQRAETKYQLLRKIAESGDK